MYDIVEDFVNYDKNPNKNIKNNYRIKKKNYPFLIYFKNGELIPPKLYFENHRFMVLKYYNLSSFINNILNSYQSIESIRNQFQLDIDRSSFHINGNKVENSITAYNYISYKYPKYKTKIIMLCTQSILADIFGWIQCNLPENYYVGESDSNNQRELKIVLEKKQLMVKKKLRIFEVIEGNSRNIRNIAIIAKINNIFKDEVISFEVFFYKLI